ncbi:MAG: NADH-quinone oxidoreductase subunit A [Acidimicrobiales bacterium]
MGSLDSYLPIFFMIVLGIAFAALSFVASKLMAPQRPTAAKEAPYECGIVPTHETSRRFPVRFYLVAMIFIIFDIEVIFLFPWAVVYNELGTFGLVEILVFVGTVFIPFCYLVSNGALDWGPARNLYRQAQDYVRTSATTVVRVAQIPPITTTATSHGEQVAATTGEDAAPPARDPAPVPTGAAYGAKAG